MIPIHKKTDLQIVFIGFSLVLLVGAGFFMKNYFQNSRSQNDASRSNAIQTDKFSSISVSDLAKKISANEKLFVFDLRDADSFSFEHILDSRNLSIEDLQKIVPDLDKGRTYFFVDDLGLTPDEIQVMQFFKDNGFTDIAYLEGGLTRWKNEYERTISAGDPYSLVDQSKVSYIRSDDLKKEISDKKSPYIIDVRSAMAFSQDHVVGAINIPLEKLENRRHEIPSGKKIVLCDDNGVGAFQGAVRLFDAGILNIYALSDGLNTWKQKGFELAVD
ncbi:MAG: rhodanese-like domain-containing protein [Parcubacteria group bacterium]